MVNSLILAVVDAHEAASAAAPDMLTKFGLDKFGIELHAIILQGISFLILFGVLYYFAIKPTIKTMGSRKEQIEAGLKYAEQMKAELAASQQRSEAALKEAQVKAQQIIAETQKIAKDYAEKQQKEAIEKANEFITKAQQAIELEHKKMLTDARGEIARLVVLTTERVLAKKLTDADRAGYNETATRELAGV